MPRPRFTRRVVLIAMTIVVVAAVAWQGGIVYQRTAALKKMQSSYSARVTPGNAAMDLQLRLNPIRKLMGDQSIRSIYIPDDIPDEELESLAKLFPEANIRKRPPQIPPGPPTSSPGPMASP